MSGYRPIGVLGGMGPQATVLLQQRLIEAVGAEDDRSHVPLLIDMNPQVPSRIGWLLEGEGEDPGPVLVRMARRLESSGVHALAMPCNTAHHFASEITRSVRIPLLDMVDLTTERLAATLPDGGPVGILASPALERVGLFHESFARHALSPLYPPDPASLLEAIRRIKARGVAAAERAALLEGARALRRLGARCLLVACTEFSLAADALVGELPVVDSLDALVDAIVAFSGVGPAPPPIRMSDPPTHDEATADGRVSSLSVSPPHSWSIGRRNAVRARAALEDTADSVVRPPFTRHRSLPCRPPPAEPAPRNDRARHARSSRSSRG